MTPLEPINILYIEDNEDDFIFVQAYLPPHYQISWCPNAHQAREKLINEHFDLILLDHGLPDTNSLSFLEEIREQRPFLPVIILTGYEDQALAVSAIKKGAANYLLKDEIAEHLETIIQKTLKDTHAPPAASGNGRFLDTADHIYKVLLETMNEGCLVTNTEGVIIFANEALGRLCGLATNALLGKPTTDIFLSESKTQLTTIFNTSNTLTTDSWSFEGRLKIENSNATLPVLVSCRQTAVGVGQTLAGFLIVLTNIAESIEARQQLDAAYNREKQRNHKLRLLLQITSQASKLDVNSLMTLVCRLISQEFSYYRVSLGTVNDDSIHIQPQHQFFRDKAVARFIDSSTDILDLRLTSIMTTAVNRKETIYVTDASKSTLFLPQEGFQAVRSEIAIPIIANDIPIAVLDIQSDEVNGLGDDDILILTLMAEHLAKALENARLFQEVVYEQERLRALINASHDGILFITPEATMPVINAQATALLQLGDDPTEWHNRSVYTMLEALKRQAPHFVLMVLTELQRIRQGDVTPQQGEIKINMITIEWQNLPVSADDVSLGWLMVLRDITQEQHVRELQQDLTRTMVHDLRNPLTSILSSLQVLKRLDSTNRDSLTERQHRSLDLAMMGSRKMLTLTNDILDVSQLESGEVPLQTESINIYNIVMATLETHIVLANDKNIFIENHVSPNLPSVWADLHMIERVLQNLLDNAIKFTPENGRIAISATQTNTKHIQVTVADNGPGIPSELHSRLFQKFVTGPHIERGSGLGLAFCKLVIEAHDGHIWLDTHTQPDNTQGATFHFTLPRAPKP